MAKHSLFAIFFFGMVGVAQAQPALTEPAEFPSAVPGPRAVPSGEECFHLASGTITPGDVDWVQILMPRATTQTIVDVDFPANGGGSALLASIVMGTTAFNIADNNGTRDSLCGLSATTIPVGSTRDSAVAFTARAANIVINIGITGAADTGFVGAHSETFTYDVWVYAQTVPCTLNSDCTDGVVCTVDSCNVATGDCFNDADDAACDNGRFCDGEEYCDAVRGCRAGLAPDCDDGVACTFDDCDPLTDECMSLPDDDFCDNEAFCDGQEWCDPLLDCQPGDAPACDDGVECTVDRCDDDSDDCAHEVDHAFCDDGFYCTGEETCDSLQDCVPGPPPLCDDGVRCTVDACDPELDECLYLPDDTACSNGLFCDGEEWCDPVAGCQSDDPSACDDGVDCTIDSCDDGANDCVHTVNHAFCDDGLYCTGEESCDALRGCVTGNPPVCDDGVSCTADTCDPDLDECLYLPDDAACGNGVFCDGEEWCDSVEGCITGDDPCPDRLCRESDDRCVNCLSDADCDDGDFCNGPESCDGQGSCVEGTPPCPPGVDCNTDTERCEAVAFTLDIQPRKCPNLFKTNGQGIVPMALTGGPGANVQEIKPGSLRLERVDGIGKPLHPNEGPHGPWRKFEDVTGPHYGEICACHRAESDGWADLVMRFDVQAMNKHLQLDKVSSGSSVALRISGRLKDGTKFEAIDCIVVEQPPRKPPRFEPR